MWPRQPLGKNGLKAKYLSNLIVVQSFHRLDLRRDCLEIPLDKFLRMGIYFRADDLGGTPPTVFPGSQRGIGRAGSLGPFL